MPNLLLEVRDNAATLLAQTNRVLYLEVTRPLDQLGRVKFAVPANDPVTEYLDADDIGVYFWFYAEYQGVDAAARTPLTVAGLYNPPDLDVIGGGGQLEVDTLDRAGDLMYRFSAEDSRWASATALSTILGTGAGTPPGLLYGTGWTLSIEAGPGALTAIAEFQGEDIAAAIAKVVQNTLDSSDVPLHWWADPVTKTLYVGVLGADSGLRLAQAEAPAPDGTLPTVIVAKLRRRGTGKLINYLYVEGGSAGADRLQLPYPKSSGAYTVQVGTSRQGATYYYLQDTVSIAAHGEFRDTFSDNSANTRNLTTTQAKDALYDAACAHLARHKDPHKAWSGQARGAVLAALDPGAALDLWYHRGVVTTLLTGNQLTREVAISETVYLTKITRRLDDQGIHYDLDLGSTLDHQLGSSRDELIGKRIAAAARATQRAATTRMATQGSVVAAGAAPANASFVTTAAESGLSSETVYNTIAGALGGFSAQTISSGVISKPGNAFCLAVDTEGGAATDDLNTINGGGEGYLIILRAANTARTVVCKDRAIGGNLRLTGGDMALDSNLDTLVLIYDGSYWLEVSRSNNGT